MKKSNRTILEEILSNTSNLDSNIVLQLYYSDEYFLNVMKSLEVKISRKTKNKKISHILNWCTVFYFNSSKLNKSYWQEIRDKL